MMLEEVVVGERSGEYGRWGKTLYLSCSAFQVLVVWHVVRCYVVVEKNWALSVDQHWLQTLQFLAHLINLPSILLRCNGFTRIQKTSGFQSSSRPPNSDCDPFSGVSLVWVSALELLLGPASELVFTSCLIKSTFHCTSQSDQELFCCCCTE